ncbi:MAG: response regulator [Candidatus Zixiibacteriota bacterium]|nr:MAG: response regulator [candidate division Zixibacteria bacterium]
MLLHNDMISILLVDDDEDCRLLVRDAIESANVKNDIYEVPTGEDALAFIRRLPPYQDMPRPGLVYLDIDMPGISGLEVLKTLKSEEETRDIPVVMMTALDDDKEKGEAANLGANSYCVKPTDPFQFIETVIKATDYWLTIHKSPVGVPAEV